MQVLVRNRTVRPLRIPNDRKAQPALPVVVERHAVNPPREGPFLFRVARFIRREDHRHLSKLFGPPRDLALEKSLFTEMLRSVLCVILHAQHAIPKRPVGLLENRLEPPIRSKQRTKAVPVPLARRPGNHVVNRTDNRVQRLHVLRICRRPSRLPGSRGWPLCHLCRLLLLRPGLLPQKGRGACRGQCQQDAYPDSRSAKSHALPLFHFAQLNRTFTSGRLSSRTVSINLTCRSSKVKIMDWVRTPSPKKRTPRSKFPSVTPQHAKIIFFPGARSCVS